MDREQLVADGWVALDIADGYSAHISPIFVKGKGEGVKVGFLSNVSHSNHHIGSVHGGAIMTFADIALGVRIRDAIGGNFCVTLGLSTHFLEAPKTGEFIWCAPELLRQGSRIAHVRGLICGEDGRTVASCEGSWRIFTSGEARPAG